eukprot:TRINITY_DN73802_c0_g1_i1.p1 TRINITY_DN73802_c0_g1~~TRINITY_DN73802_c0_g1_i1.p1  ORF type:complete len:538 (-),score=87.71 TRINITY_DN73802_c0_g1_i1:48-1661(-)
MKAWRGGFFGIATGFREGGRGSSYLGTKRGGSRQRCGACTALRLCRLDFRFILASTFVFLQDVVAGIVEGQKELRAALALNPGDAHLHTALAYSYQRNSQVDAAEESYLTALRLEPTIAEAHANLGHILHSKHKTAEAELRFKTAISLDPELTVARLNLVRLRLARATAEGNSLEVEAALRQVLELDPSNTGWNSDRITLAKMLAERGAKKEAMAVIRTAVKLVERKGELPVSLIINFLLIKEEGWRKALLEEKHMFSSVCKGARKRGIANARKLPSALAALRQLESSRSWVAEYFVERYSLFGSDEESAGYGGSWFNSFIKVVGAHERVSNVLGGRSEVGSKPPQVYVAGSGLGEACLFAAALGAHCLGFEVICDSMVGGGTAIIKSHGLQEQVKLLCGDATGEDAEATLMGRDPIDLAWLNDFVWPESLKKRMWVLLARVLRPGSIVVSLKDTAKVMPDGLSKFIEGTFIKLTTVEASFTWDMNQPVDIWERTATFSPTLEGPASTTLADGSCTADPDGSCLRLDETTRRAALGS